MSGETAAIALANLSFGMARPSEGEAADAARIQRGIDACMREVIKTAGYNPAMRDPSPRVPVGGAAPVAPRGNGWAKDCPLESPMSKGSFIESVIGGMIDQALGPAVPKPEAEGS